MKERISLFAVLILLVGVSAYPWPWAGGGGGGGGGSTDAGDLASGTLPAARIGDNSVVLPTKAYSTGGTPSATTYFRGDNTWNTPAAGTGTVTGPASATQDNVACWGADNTAIKDCGYSATPAAKGGTGQNSSGSTGVPYVLSGTWSFKTPAQILAILGLSSTDNVTFGSVTSGDFISTAVDNTRGVTAMNSARPTGANLVAGKCWYLKGATSATDTLECDNSDNTAVGIMGAVVKTFAFGIDNVITSDDILLWKAPRALTITQVDCYASTDNVVGVLSECTAGDVTSCTAVDSSDWTVTNATSGFSVNSGFENASIAAGAWLKWVTTSVGTTNSNKLSCTVQYRE